METHLKFIQLEQGIKNLIQQSELSILIIESILKNILHETQESKQQFLIQLQKELEQYQENITIETDDIIQE